MELPAVNSRAHTAPGPKGDWLLGHIRPFRRDALGLLLNAAREFGDVVRFRLGPHVVHLVNHPEHIERVLVTHQQNYERSARSAQKISAICGESLLTSHGETWRRQRRLMQPAFHQQRIAQFAALMADAATATADRWNHFARRGEAFDLAAEMSRLTFIIVARVLFGAEVKEDAATVERALPVLLGHTYRRLETLLDLPTSLPLPANLRFRQALAEVDEVVHRIIAERRQSDGQRHDLLSMLLSACDAETGQPLSDAELRNQTIALLLAGHETTANALAWTFYLVSQSSEIEEQLHAELVANLKGYAPTLEDVSRLRLLSQAFDESLRLYPPIWALERRVLADDSIASFRIPAGSTVVISPYVLHRHPGFWSDPERFDPTRFTEAASTGHFPNAYLPFGAGPHQCIGNNFALLEARIILATLLQRFRVGLVPGQPVEPKPGITLRPRHGIVMTVAQVSEG
jgi:cytochrome P450